MRSWRGRYFFLVTTMMLIPSTEQPVDSTHDGVSIKLFMYPGVVESRPLQVGNLESKC